MANYCPAFIPPQSSFLHIVCVLSFNVVSCLAVNRKDAPCLEHWFCVRARVWDTQTRSAAQIRAGFFFERGQRRPHPKQTNGAQLSRINTVSFPLSSKSHPPPDKPLHLRPASSPWQIRPIRAWYSGVMWQHWCLRLWSDAQSITTRTTTHHTHRFSIQATLLVISWWNADKSCS